MHSILYILFLIFGCQNPLSPESKGGNYGPTTSTSTQYQEKQGNAQTSVALPDGTSFKIRLGVTDPTNVVDGTIMERYKKLGERPEMVIALWIEAAILAQQGKEEGWSAL